MAYTVIQKENTRYTFDTKETNSGSKLYRITTEQMCTSGLGSSVSYRYVSKEEGNAFYTEMMGKGFHKFRNAREISWYATRENNTPFDEEWKAEGEYLVPIKSRVLYYFSER